MCRFSVLFVKKLFCNVLPRAVNIYSVGAGPGIFPWPITDPFCARFNWCDQSLSDLLTVQVSHSEIWKRKTRVKAIDSLLGSHGNVRIRQIPVSWATAALARWMHRRISGSQLRVLLTRAPRYIIDETTSHLKMVRVSENCCWRSITMILVF